MKVRTYALLVMAASVVLGYAVFWFAIQPDPVAAVLVAIVLVPAGIAGGILGLRAVDPSRLDMTLGEVRRREREGTLEPAISQEYVRVTGWLTLAAYALSAFLVVPTMWFVVSHRAAIVMAVVVALGAPARYFAQRMMRRASGSS